MCFASNKGWRQGKCCYLVICFTLFLDPLHSCVLVEVAVYTFVSVCLYLCSLSLPPLCTAIGIFIVLDMLPQYALSSLSWLYLIQQFSQLDIFSITGKLINQYGRGQGRMQEPPVNQDILKTLYSSLANMTNKIEPFFGNLYH